MSAASAGADATQFVGVAAFGAAAACCAWRGVRALAHGDRVVWRSLTVVHAILAIEVIVGVRYEARLAVDAWLETRRLYAGRDALQWALVAATIAALALGTAMLLRVPRRAAALRFALLGSAAAVAVFVVESVSMHRVDAILYAAAGPIRFVGWPWVGSAAVVCVGPWRDTRRLPALRSPM